MARYRCPGCDKELPSQVVRAAELVADLAAGGKRPSLVIERSAICPSCNRRIVVADFSPQSTTEFDAFVEKFVHDTSDLNKAIDAIYDVDPWDTFGQRIWKRLSQPGFGCALFCVALPTILLAGRTRRFALGAIGFLLLTGRVCDWTGGSFQERLALWQRRGPKQTRRVILFEAVSVLLGAVMIMVAAVLP